MISVQVHTVDYDQGRNMKQMKLTNSKWPCIRNYASRSVLRLTGFLQDAGPPIAVPCGDNEAEVV